MMRIDNLNKSAVGASLLIISLLTFAPNLWAQAQALTFTPRYEGKLFINTIPNVNCAASAMVRFPGAGAAAIARRAAFAVFCLGTPTDVPNPVDGSIMTPLDARIAGGVHFKYQCNVNAPVPIPSAPSIVGAPTAGGVEVDLVLTSIDGVVNPVAPRNQLLAGKWGYILSGHPAPILEPGFTAAGGARATPDIWQHYNGTVVCGVDNRGLPTSTLTNKVTATSFPSHRVWFLESNHSTTGCSQFPKWSGLV